MSDRIDRDMRALINAEPIHLDGLDVVVTVDGKPETRIFDEKVLYLSLGLIMRKKPSEIGLVFLHGLGVQEVESREILRQMAGLCKDEGRAEDARGPSRLDWSDCGPDPKEASELAGQGVDQPWTMSQIHRD